MSYGRYRDDDRGQPFDSRGEILVGRVKWFDPGKGFGFVQVEGIGKDPFLHANVLNQFGYRQIAEGATIRFVAQQSPKGLSVGSIESIDEGTAGPMERRDRGGHGVQGGQGRGGFDRREPEAAVEGSLEATVKWYNHDKGFGFFSNPGGEDLFVHATALRASGIQDLYEGDRYLVHIGTNRGRKCVVRIEPA